MKQEARSGDRPARENYAKLMRHEDGGSAWEAPEKPVCTEKPECVGCPYPAYGFVCWGDKRFKYPMVWAYSLCGGVLCAA